MGVVDCGYLRSATDDIPGAVAGAGYLAQREDRVGALGAGLADVDEDAGGNGTLLRLASPRTRSWTFRSLSGEPKYGVPFSVYRRSVVVSSIMPIK